MSCYSLPLQLCRGHVAASMQGKRNGVATKIKNEVPVSLAVHCFDYCLNLSLQDAGRKLDFLRDSLDIVKEIVSSHLKDLIFMKSWLSQTALVFPSNLYVLPIGPRTEAIETVLLKDYSILLELMEEIHHTMHTNIIKHVTYFVRN